MLPQSKEHRIYCTNNTTNRSKFKNPSYSFSKIKSFYSIDNHKQCHITIHQKIYVHLRLQCNHITALSLVSLRTHTYTRENTIQHVQCMYVRHAYSALWRPDRDVAWSVKHVQTMLSSASFLFSSFRSLVRCLAQLRRRHGTLRRGQLTGTGW